MKNNQEKSIMQHSIQTRLKNSLKTNVVNEDDFAQKLKNMKLPQQAATMNSVILESAPF